MQLRWITNLFSRLGAGSADTGAAAREAPLMTRTEKIELEALLEERFADFFARHGGRAFLEAGWAVSLSAAHGPRIACDPPDSSDLARVELRDLLSIRSLLTTELPHIAVTQNMLPNLATEATHALALQVNRAAAEIIGAPGGSSRFQSETSRRNP